MCLAAFSPQLRTLCPASNQQDGECGFWSEAKTLSEVALLGLVDKHAFGRDPLLESTGNRMKCVHAYRR